MGKYISPFTDFGFKKLFGEKASIPILIDFLNCIIPNYTIKTLHFKDKEKLGKTEFDRKAIFDLYCENEKGEKFIIELQKSKQKYFKDRSVFYSSFPIQEQGQQGDWDFELKSVFCVGILGFEFEDEKKSNEKIKHIDAVLHIVELKNQHNQVFYEKLKFIYLELPHFKKKEDELKTQLDKWLYFIKHLDGLDKIPTIFKDSVFVKAFEQAELAKLNPEERKVYEQSLKVSRDNTNVINYSFDEGIKKGEEIGIKKGEEMGIKKGRTEGEEIGIKKGRTEGEEIGIKKGEEVGIEKTIQIITFIKQGKTNEAISKKMNIGIKQIDKIRKSI